MESIEEMKRSVECYYDERFKYEEPIDKLVEYATSLLYSIDRDPELFLSCLNDREIHMYNYLLNDIIKYRFEQMTITVPLEHTQLQSPPPASGSHLAPLILAQLPQRYETDVLHSNLDLWRSGDNITERHRVENLISGLKEPDFQTLDTTPIFPSQSTPESALQISNIPHQIARRSRFTSISEEISPIPARAQDSITSVLVEAASAQPVGEARMESDTTFQQYHSIEPIRPADHHQQSSSLNIIEKDTPENLDSFMPLTRKSVVHTDPNMHSTPLATIPVRQLLPEFESIENLPEEQFVNLPELEQDDHLVQKFEQMFATRRKERRKRAIPAVYRTRDFRRIRIRGRENERTLDISNFLFAGENQSTLLNLVEFLMENTIRLPPVLRRHGTSTAKRTERSGHAPVASSPLSSRLSLRQLETIPQIREDATEQQHQSTQPFAFIHETPEQASVPGQVREISLTDNSRIAQLSDPHVVPLPEILPDVNITGSLEYNRTVPLQEVHAPDVQGQIADQYDRITPFQELPAHDEQMPIAGRLPEAISEQNLAMPGEMQQPEIMRTPVRNTELEFPRNWSEILRERNLEMRALYRDIPGPLQSKRKRRRYFHPREVGDALPRPIQDENLIPEISHDLAGHQVDTFPEQFRQWKLVVLENIQTGRFLGVPKYSVRLADSLDFGQAINEILRTVVTSGNVERDAILPSNLSRKDAVKRIRALFELQSKNVLCLITNGTEIRSISLSLGSNTEGLRLELA